MVIGGEISYSFYLIHLFVLLSYRYFEKPMNKKIKLLLNK